MTLRLVVLMPVLLLVACGGAATAAQSARTTACRTVELRIADSEATYDEKVRRLQCVRTACDEIHDEIERRADE